MEPDTQRFVSTAADFCKGISRFDGGNRRTVSQVILEGMEEEESGWRHDLWEAYQPDEGV